MAHPIVFPFASLSCHLVSFQSPYCRNGYRWLTFRRIARAVAWIRFLTSKDLSFIRRHLLSNCQHIYKKRIQGKTRCNYLRYYGCKIRDSLLCVPHYRHTLILDLDETLIYSCRYSDLSLMVPSLESVGVTIVLRCDLGVIPSCATIGTSAFMSTSARILTGFWMRCVSGTMSSYSPLERNRMPMPSSMSSIRRDGWRSACIRTTACWWTEALWNELKQLAGISAPPLSSITTLSVIGLIKVLIVNERS